jgi:hypothetical protein
LGFNQVQKLLLCVARSVGNVMAVAVGLQVNLEPIHVGLATRPGPVSCSVLVIVAVAVAVPPFVVTSTACCLNKVKQVLLCVFGSEAYASLTAVLL